MSSTAETVRAEYRVSGMTCEHCVASVSEEVGAIAGVDDVSVSLNAGGLSSVVVTSSVPVEVREIRSAIDEAGYSLVEAPK